MGFKVQKVIQWFVVPWRSFLQWSSSRRVLEKNPFDGGFACELRPRSNRDNFCTKGGWNLDYSRKHKNTLVLYYCWIFLGLDAIDFSSGEIFSILTFFWWSILCWIRWWCYDVGDDWNHIYMFWWWPDLQNAKYNF